MPLDPAADQLLSQLGQMMPEIGTMSAAEARAKIAAVGDMMAPPELVTSVRDESVAVGDTKITVRIYRPDVPGPVPAVAYFHGGGFVLGRLQDYDALLDTLAARVGCLVASVEYRMAPEDRFPTAVEDCHAALRWVVEHAAELDLDPSRVAVAGDSSGGNLAAAVALMARDRGGPPIAFQVLVYPVARCHLDPQGYVQGVDTPPLTTSAMAWYSGQYLASEEEAQHPYASPVLAPDHAGLPPALLITAEVDPLRDDALELGDRLRRAGVPVTASHYSDMFHGFYSFRGFLAHGDQAFEEVVATLRTRL